MHALNCIVTERSRLIPLSVSPNSDKSGKQSLYPDGDLDRHQNLISCSLAHCQPSMKISCKCVWKFLCKISNRQDKQRRKHNLHGGGNDWWKMTNKYPKLRLTDFLQMVIDDINVQIKESITHLANTVWWSVLQHPPSILGFVQLNTSYNTLHLTHGCKNTRMWANAQRDNCPGEYWWRPLFNAAVWLTPTTRVPCSNAAKMRNPLKCTAMPQTHQQISAASGSKSTIL